MRRTSAIVAVAVCVLQLIVPFAVFGARQALGTTGCRPGNPLINVTDANRFTVLATCVSLTGMVKSTTRAGDGAYQVDVAPDARFRGLLSAGNNTARHGNLLIEISPADAARGVRPLRIGSHVYIVGALLLNKNHGWNELYPVWAFQPASAAPKRMPGSGAGGYSGQGGQTGTGASNNAPEPKKFFVTVAVTPRVMHHGYKNALATVLTVEGAHCDAALTYERASNPLGALFGMAGQNAPADGKITWSWSLDYNILGGGSVAVTCTYQGVTVKAVGTFTIVP